jgi:hypothetical protein
MMQQTLNRVWEAVVASAYANELERGSVPETAWETAMVIADSAVEAASRSVMLLQRRTRGVAPFAQEPAGEVQALRDTA